MAERAKRTISATPEGLKQIEEKRRISGKTAQVLGNLAGVSRSLTQNFFAGKPISVNNFQELCTQLELDWEEVAGLKEAIADPKPETHQVIGSAELDDRVQDIRQKVHVNIQKRCGEMRVLDMSRPIDLDTIYTDVNVLQDITGRRRLGLAELLQRCSLEEFDRFGFAHALTERRSGLEAVEEFDKLMLLGKPGAGKTTFLKRLSTLCNQGSFQKHRVPIFITLKEFGDSSEQPKLLPYISQWLREVGVQELQAIEQILNQGRGLLLLDGLDEVSERTTQQVLQEIQSFSNRFSKNAFVVSCRIAAKEFTFQQFTDVEVADFNDGQIADFASRWFQAKQLPEKTKHFLKELKGQPRIKELATNPLLLTLLCLVFEGRTDFPANRSELYKEGLDVLLKKWDGTRSIKREQVYRELSLRRKEDLLSQLAFTTFESGNYFFKQKDAEHLIETYIQNLPGAHTDPEALRLDSEAVLKSIEAQHGLLVERARSIYSFSHLTFHEYFVACELETRDDLPQVLMSHLTEKRWREVILLTVGMLKNADSLLREMKSQIDGMLATDQKLQQFLTWVQQKSESVNASYKPAAIRAFYFALARTFDLDRVIEINLARASIRERVIDLALARDLDLALARDLDRDRDLDNALDLDNARDLDRNLARDLDRDRNLDRALAIAIALAFYFDLDLDLALARDLDNAITIASHLNRNLVSNLASGVGPTLQEPIKELKGQLPNPDKDWDKFLQWWQTEGSAWTEQLRALMIEHRNIGHDWQFSDTQKQQLQQYYDANKLLVDCLNSECYISRDVRAEIEGSLLLPLNS